MNGRAAVIVVAIVLAVVLMLVLAGVWLPPAGDFGPGPLAS